MTRLLLKFIVPLLICGTIQANDTTEKERKVVWKAFHEVRFAKFGKFQHVDVYAEKPDFSQICYMNDGVVYIFYYKDPNKEGVSHIQQAKHAKVINPKINRITYIKSKDLKTGSFQLWHYENLELSMGSS